jgi:hypothetical protein
MRKTLNWMLAAVVAFGVMSQGASAGGPNNGARHNKSLAGAWFINVTPTLIPSFVSIGTFGADGTLTNISSVSLAFPPGTAASGVPESPGYGVWVKKGAHTYAITFLTITQDGTGTFSGSQKVRSTVTIGPGGNQLTGTFQVDVFDAGGSLLGSDTGTLTGTRIKVEPL